MVGAKGRKKGQLSDCDYKWKEVRLHLKQTPNEQNIRNNSLQDFEKQAEKEDSPERHEINKVIPNVVPASVLERISKTWCREREPA